MKGMVIKFAIASALVSVIAAGAASASISTPQAEQSATTSQRLSDLAKLYRSNIQPQRP